MHLFEAAGLCRAHRLQLGRVCGPHPDQSLSVCAPMQHKVPLRWGIRFECASFFATGALEGLLCTQ